MPVERIPVAFDYDFRGIYQGYSPTNGRDVRRLNIMEEPKSNGKGFYVLKRPGFFPAVSLGVTGQGQGLTEYNNAHFAIISDQLVTLAPANSGTNGTAFTQLVASAAWNIRTQFQTAVLNDTLYVLGGLNLTSATNGDVWQTRDGTNWTVCTSSAPWSARWNFGCCVLNGLIYVMGGRNPIGSLTFSDVWSSPDGTTWTLVTSAAPWGPRTGMQCIAANNGIYLIGGNNTGFGTWYNDVWFSSDGATWSQVCASAGWAGRQQFCAVYLNNKFYLWGGEIAAGTYTADAWTSSNGGVTWTQTNANAFGTARWGQGCCVYNNKMWALGGLDGGLAQKSEVWSSPDGVTWNSITVTPGWNARAFPGVAVFRTPTAVSSGHYSSIWVLGGHLQGASTNDVWYGNLNIALTTTTALTPPVGGQMYQLASFAETTSLLIKNQSAMWVYTNGTLQLVTDQGYPSETVPGIVTLGNAAYVMDPTGLIHNCPLENPLQWPSLNVLGADYDDDPGIAIAKYQNFLVAFGTFTTQFFYDAGNPVGSPLASYAAANIKVGCASANTIVEIGNNIVWMSQNKQGKRQIVMFNGVTPEPISTPYIDELIQYKANFVSINTAAYGITGLGKHTFYVLSFADGTGSSWVYDFLSKRWYEWQLASGSAPNFIGQGFLVTGQAASSSNYLLDGAAGQLMLVSGGVWDTGGVPFHMQLVTTKLDMGNNRNKFWSQVEIIGDKPGSSCTPAITFSDDDGFTYSATRTVDISTPRPVLYQNGVSRRRTIKFDLTDTVPIRLEDYELTYTQGT